MGSILVVSVRFHIHILNDLNTADSWELADADAGSTLPSSEPYVVRYTDEYGNVCSQSIPRPDIVCKYVEHSNAVDVHNNLRQHCLALEDKWVTGRVGRF